MCFIFDRNCEFPFTEIHLKWNITESEERANLNSKSQIKKSNTAEEQLQKILLKRHNTLVLPALHIYPTRDYRIRIPSLPMCVGGK